MCLLFQGLLEQIIVFDERQVWSKFCDVINERPCNVSYLICHLKIKNEEILDQFFSSAKNNRPVKKVDYSTVSFSTPTLKSACRRTTLKRGNTTG